MEIVEGEERYLNVGATVQGRVLLVVTTWREDRVRVVTAFGPIKRIIQFYGSAQEFVGSAGIAELGLNSQFADG